MSQAMTESSLTNALNWTYSISGMIAYKIGTRGKSVKFKVGDMFDVEAEFH